MTTTLKRLLYAPTFWCLAIYALGIWLRVDYSLNVNPPEAHVSSDMGLYVDLARRLGTGAELHPWDVTHPLGYPALVSFLLGEGGGLGNVARVQIFVSCLVPLAVGLLALAAFGRRTALVAVAVASIYFPYIEYGALFLSEIHFILWLTLAFAAFLGARQARSRAPAIGLALAGGIALSIAAAFKSVALPAAAAFFLFDALALQVKRGGAPLRATFAPLLTRAVLVGLGAAPLLGVLARVCTAANRGNFCVTGNKVGADFLLGHYGRIADIHWADDEGHGFGFGSPGAYLRHYEAHPSVPFPITDNAANSAEAWRWILRHPFEALVVSLDHLYDTFLGTGMWPTYATESWPLAHLSQVVFVALLLVPVLFACARILRRGVGAFVASRTLLLLAPVLALAAVVAFATGEVRYRIPFDVFFIAIAAAMAVGELERPDQPAEASGGPFLPDDDLNTRYPNQSSAASATP
jgi:hypothetical protein